MKRTEVLIIGAGPTGLIMACQFALRNISFRIIDKTDDHTTQSRALAVHARSLEIFQQMGIADEAIVQGKIAKAVNLFVNGKRYLRLPLENIGRDLTDFPYVLILEQSKTEALLISFLNRYGLSVERNKELINLSQTKNGVTAIVQNKNGEKETIETNWLVGADGAHSAVREQLQIPFLGKTYHQSLFVLDCKMNLDFPSDEVYILFSKETVALLFPLVNERCRVLGFVEKEFENEPKITFEEVSKNFAKRTHLNIQLTDPQWISKYNTHHRVVSAFRKNRCFIAGDAAHIHSPVGGQGMNTGLQDAYNLAWKLALVIQNKAKENLLDTYDQERIIIAKRLVNSTDRAFNYVTSENKFVKFYLIRILPFLLKILKVLMKHISLVTKIIFKNLSEIALHYRNSKLSMQDNSSFKYSSIKPGDRVPYNSLRKEFTDGIYFHILLFSKNKSAENIVDEFAKVCERYSGLIKINKVPFNFNTEKIYNQFGIKKDGFYLIRPDSYIAYRSDTLKVEKLNDYLKRILMD